METSIVVAVGVISALATQALVSWLQYRRGLLEKLVGFYGELLGIAADDLHRAKVQAGSFALMSSSPSEEFRNEIHALEEKRLHNLGDFKRLELQIQMLEFDNTLCELASNLQRNQPFIVAGKWGEGNFDSRFEQFEKSIAAFGETMDRLAKAVRKRYAQSLVFGLAKEN